MRGLFLFAAAILCGAPAAAAPSAEAFAGLYAYETTFGTALGGELKVTRDGERWQAHLGEARAECGLEAGAIRCIFANGGGAFRGALAKPGTLEGYWLRPAIAEDPRDGASQAFATPLVFKRSGDEWTATVVPLVDRFRLYLKIFPNEEGALIAAFRDPETNDIGGASRFFTEIKSEDIAFGFRNDAGKFEPAFKGWLQGDTLSVDWPALGREIALKRVTPEETSGFLPRPAGDPAYVYAKPAQTSDGWKTARASDVGIDEAALARFATTIIKADPASRRPSLIHSVLVARKGKLIFEEYFFGYDRETPHDTRSAGKTFASVMLGAAMMEGAEIAPGSKIYDVLRSRGPFANPDPRKEKITLAHLMTHSAGLSCNDNDEASPGNEGTMQNQTAQPDWWKHTLDLPMAFEPGARYAYCSANINLVGGALTEATQTWLPQYFDRTVARKLEFGRYYWNLTPTEDGYLGGGSFLRPRDLLKVGQAFLDGGEWRGRRIVPQKWVTESTASRIAITPETTGYSEEEFGDFYGRGEDAYAWHLGEVTAGEKRYRTYAATGNGGQLLVVAPQLDLVAVFTGGNYRQGGIWSRWPQELIGAEIAATMKE